jgi:hypothetical protein
MLPPTGGPDTDAARPPATYAARLERARAALAANAGSAADNELVGRHLCFKAGEWDQGLPLLARGGSGAVATAAATELRAQSEPVALIRAAKTWWDVAADTLPSTDEAWLPIRAHAKALYLANVAKLTDREMVGVVERWLDDDADFRQQVGNKRPGAASSPTATR